jgi:hypothetical protein
MIVALYFAMMVAVRWSAADALRGLRRLRNIAVHGGGEDISRERAAEFINLAYHLTGVLEQRPG